GKLTEEEASDHPQKSIITRALGPEPVVEVDSQTLSLRHDDVFLLCSDGLTSMVDEAQIARILTAGGSLTQAGQALVAAANEAGGRDNIPVVLFRLEDVQGAAAADQPTSAGTVAPRTEDVRAAAAAYTPPAATATAERVERRAPRPRVVAEEPHRRR